MDSWPSYPGTAAHQASRFALHKKYYTGRLHSDLGIEEREIEAASDMQANTAFKIYSLNDRLKIGGCYASQDNCSFGFCPRCGDFSILPPQSKRTLPR